MTFDIYLIEQINPAYMSRNILLECLKLVQNHKKFEQHEDFNKKEHEKKCREDDEYFAEVLVAEIEKVKGDLEFQYHQKNHLEREEIRKEQELEESNFKHHDLTQEQDLQKSIEEKEFKLNELENRYNHLLLEVMEWEVKNYRPRLEAIAKETIKAALKPQDVFNLECLKFIIRLILGKQASDAEVEQVKQNLIKHPDFKKDGNFNEDHLKFIAKFILGDKASSEVINNKVNLIQSNLKFKVLGSFYQHPSVMEFVNKEWQETQTNIEQSLSTRALPHQLIRMVPKLKMVFKRVYDEELEKDKDQTRDKNKVQDSAIVKALDVVSQIHAPVSGLNTEAIPVANYAQFFRGLYAQCKSHFGLDLKILFNKTALQMALEHVKHPEYRDKIEQYQQELDNLSNLPNPNTMTLIKLFLEKDQQASELQLLKERNQAVLSTEQEEAGVSLQYGN